MEVLNLENLPCCEESTAGQNRDHVPPCQGSLFMLVSPEGQHALYYAGDQA